MQFGSYIHEIFEHGVHATTLQELYSLAEKFKDKYQFSKSYNSFIQPCLENFLRLNAQLTETIATEQAITIEHEDGYELVAIIDRLVKGKDGGILILDYKTGKNEKTKFDLFKDRQLQKYVLAVHKKLNVPIKDISAGHFYPRTNNLVVIKYISTQILAEEKKTTNTIWEIRKRKATEFPFTKNKYCNRCSYRKYCDLFNDPMIANQRIQEAKDSRSNQK